jgi:DNA-binding PucR family transcriptional regulator
MAAASDDPVVNGVATLIGQLTERRSALAESVQRLLVGSIGELRDDTQLLQLLRDSLEANIETVFSAARHGIPIENLEAPTAALEHARRLAQRGVSMNVLVRAYRFGHKAVLEEARDELRRSGLESKLSLDILGQVAEVTFGYVDWITDQVVDTYQAEHDRWMENRNSLRTLRVREILDGGEIDVDAMSAEIRYPLNRTHVAAVVWCAGRGAGNELSRMEKFVHQLGEAIGAETRPLFIPLDRTTGWVWIPLTAATAADSREGIFAFAEAQPDAPWIAIGDPVAHLEGFRHSHWQAQRVHAVAVTLGYDAPRMMAASDPGLLMAGLLGGNVASAASWVWQVLGPLASRTESDERLRETLRVFLGAGSSFKAAAHELHLHFNTVKYRVQRALERRGRPLTDDRLDVEVALALCHWYGPAVLS